METFCSNLQNLHKLAQREGISLDSSSQFLSLVFDISDMSSWPPIFTGSDLKSILVFFNIKKTDQNSSFPLFTRVLASCLTSLKTSVPEEVLGQIMEVVAMPYISASKDLGFSAAQLLATIFVIAPDDSQTKSKILALLSTPSPSSIQLTQSILSQFQKTQKPVPEILWKSVQINFQQLLSKFVTTRISGQQAKVAETAKSIVDMIEVTAFHSQIPTNFLAELFKVASSPDLTPGIAVDTLFRFSQLFRKHRTHFDVFELPEFWNILLNGILLDHLPTRRQSVFLLKEFVSEIQQTKKESPFISQWNSNQWDQFFVILDTLEESKSHLFCPVWESFPALLKLQAPPQDLKEVAVKWIIALFQRGDQSFKFYY